MLKRVCIGIFVFLLTIAPSLNCMASAYDAHPKLVIVLAIDQLREDSLRRFQADFKPEGFNLFLHRGAYFPDCYFDDGNLAAAAASATIATGAYTDGHSISGNQWWDLRRNAKRPVTAVEDPRYSIVGLPAGTPSPREGASPRNLSATTLGDAVRLATQGESKLYGVSPKARAAILLAGHTANGAFWIDPASGAFISSTYYMSALPAWAAAFNRSDATPQPQTPPQAGASPSDSTAAIADAALAHEFAFVQALIQGEHLGAGNVTDVLTVGIPAADIPGQSDEPDSLQQRQSLDRLDANLDQFFQWLDKNIPGGLRNVWIALTADRGVAPASPGVQQLGVPAATLNLKALVAALNKNMNDRFSPNQHFAYLLPDQTLPYIALNSPVFEHAGINELEGEQAIQNAVPTALAALLPASARKPDSTVQPSAVRLPPQPQIVRTFTRLQMAARQAGLPPTELGRLLAHSYSPRGGWYVLLVPAAYQTQSAKNSDGADFSPYSDDRHVPLAFYGSRFIPGIDRGRVGPVDLAATLAALLDINPPSASVGHILTQAIRPEKMQRPGRRAAQRRKLRAPVASQPAHSPAAAHPQTKNAPRSASPHP